MTMTTRANDIQVGGTHYRSEFQHWDFVAKYHLGYFEGQVSKYITRHRSKNGKQDVQKALHFLDKMIEVARVPVIPWWKILVRESWYYPQHDNVPQMEIIKYCTHNKLGYDETCVVGFVCTWDKVEELVQARYYVQTILATYDAIERMQKTQNEQVKFEADYDGSATGAYVNQDVKIEVTCIEDNVRKFVQSAISGHNPAGGHS